MYDILLSLSNLWETFFGDFKLEWLSGIGTESCLRDYDEVQGY